MKNKKKIIGLVILVMAVGFAAISTTLIINGSAKIGENIDDFDVYFSEAILDGKNISTEAIGENGKAITYTTSELKTVGQTSVLDFEVTNASKNYDANVSIECDAVNSDYISVSLEPTNFIIDATTTKNGKVNVKLNKNAVEEQTITFKCRLTINASERTSLGNGTLSAYKARNIAYDDTNTKMGCSNVQDCLDKLAQVIG